MKSCPQCKTKKGDSDFYADKARGGLARWCKKCANSYSADRVKAWRARQKLALMERAGNKCSDCGFTGPPYMFDFDHRDPSQKSFGIASSRIANWEKLIEEADKCDLVCANCHRHRTHKQSCDGCEYCNAS